MSKSVGNIVDPFEVGQQVTADGLRYFLLRHAVPHSDASEFSRKLRDNGIMVFLEFLRKEWVLQNSIPKEES